MDFVQLIVDCGVMWGSTGVVSKVQVKKIWKNRVRDIKDGKKGELRTGSVFQQQLRFGLVNNPISRYRLIQAFISLSVTGYHTELSAGPLFCSADKLV